MKSAPLPKQVANSAGAMSMAAGEYVSVSSQSDTERADIAREKQALAESPDTEHAEIAIYEHRGLSPETARLVAKELTKHDALGPPQKSSTRVSTTYFGNEHAVSAFTIS